jgi:hypothetical protein
VQFTTAATGGVAFVLKNVKKKKKKKRSCLWDTGMGWGMVGD